METIDWNDKQFRKNYMKQYNTKYYQQNKDVLCSRVKCECGKLVNLSSLKRHIESNYHNKRMMDKNEYVEMKKNKVLSKSI